MKKIRRIITMLFTLILSLSFVACGGSDVGGGDVTENVDDTKTQLYVSNYDGGFGTEWLEKIKTRFESAYANESFEDGKTGVQIVIRRGKDSYIGDNLYSSFAGNTSDVFFTENFPYASFLADDYLMDITDVVDGTVNYNEKDSYKDSKTIKSKMTQDQVDYLTRDGKIYAIPNYLGLNGIVYDMDLFNERSFYFAKNGCPSEAGYGGAYSYTNYAGVRSAGPDGVYETYDDGLPATYEEFFVLCREMVNGKDGGEKITPFTITGKYAGTYGNNIIGSFAVDYEGANGSLDYKLNGSEKLMSVDSFTVDAIETVINNENGYEVFRQAGKYYALKFFEGIGEINGCIDEYFNDSSDEHTTAQKRYLNSADADERIGNRIAFLFEGNWWENEATDNFTYMAENINAKYAKNVRKLGFLPFPKATKDKIGSGTTLIDNNRSFGFIRKNIDAGKVKLAKTFLQFCYTDYSLEEFTITTGQPKALKYDVDENKLTSEFSKQVWSLYENATLINPYSTNSKFNNNMTNFTYKNMFVASDGTSAFNNLVEYKPSKNVTADSLFGYIYNKQKDNWSNLR